MPLRLLRGSRQLTGRRSRLVEQSSDDYLRMRWCQTTVAAGTRNSLPENQLSAPSDVRIVRDRCRWVGYLLGTRSRWKVDRLGGIDVIAKASAMAVFVDYLVAARPGRHAAGGPSESTSSPTTRRAWGKTLVYVFRCSAPASAGRGAVDVSWRRNLRRLRGSRAVGSSGWCARELLGRVKWGRHWGWWASCPDIPERLTEAANWADTGVEARQLRISNGRTDRAICPL